MNLHDWQIKIVYRPGEINANADTLFGAGLIAEVNTD